jgi:CBS domain-containing protein
MLSRRGVRRAPVAAENGDLLGIVTLDDLLPLIAEELTALAQLIGRQAKRET